MCLILGLLRNKFRDDKRRMLVKELHAYHRSTYMKERQAYQRRASKAVEHPSDFFSDIGDGMSCNKTKCPHNSDRYDFKPALPMHIQGQLAHGRFLHIYRSFHNLSAGSNLANHCWLHSLEIEYKKNMAATHNAFGLPDTLYHQIDGGSENTAKATLALCELLVAKRLTRKIVLSRLPVGHTHEDIDAVFGTIWTYLMNSKGVLTPQVYANVLHQAVQNKEKDVKVFDVWAVPDYQAYFKDSINPNLGHYAKGKWSQLQIIFEATDISEDHPLGVKVSHRAFCSDDVKLLKRLPKHLCTHTDVLDAVEEANSLVNDPLAGTENEMKKLIAKGEFPGIIWDTDIANITDQQFADAENVRIGEAETARVAANSGARKDEDCDSWKFSLGYTPVTFLSRTYPSPGQRSCYIMQRFPQGDLQPQPFEEGSRHLLEQVNIAVIKKFGHLFPGVVGAWRQFLDDAPANDDVYDWIIDHPLDIPFRKELFGLDDAEISTENFAVAQKRADRVALARTATLSTFDDEVWMAEPSMRFTQSRAPSDVPYKRVRMVTDTSTELPPHYQDFYNDGVDSQHQEYEDSSADEADGIPRWCTVRNETMVRQYGDAKSYLGRVFKQTVSRKRTQKRSRRIAEIVEWRINKVVRKLDVLHGAIHFECIRQGNMGSSDDPVEYFECRTVMSTRKNSTFRLVPLPQERRITTRSAQRHWVYVHPITGEEIDEQTFRRQQASMRDSDCDSDDVVCMYAIYLICNLLVNCTG